MTDRDPALGDTPPTLERYPTPAIWTGEIVTASMRKPQSKIERYLAMGGASSMIAHSAPPSPLPKATPLMFAAATGPLPLIDHHSLPVVKTDDITTARMRAAPSRHTRGAPPAVAHPPASSAPSVIVDTDMKQIPGPEAPGLARGVPAGPPNAISAIDALIETQVKNLFDFAKSNNQDARRDSLSHWALKIPAIAGAMAASACQAFGYGSLMIIFAALTAICIAVDGARPSGLLHNVHKRAANEARRAATALRSGWHLVQLECEGQLEQQRSRATDLFRAAHAERQRITDYVLAAEACAGSSTRTTGS